jgi:ADP-ribose pyrophosphatase YjhB (NUDIX family)
MGEWCLPGGKVDYCETVEEAAKKEVREETSLICKSLKFLFYQDSLPDIPGEMHCINLYLECKAEGNVVLNKESSEFAWIDPESSSKYHLVFRNGEGLSRYWKEKTKSG